MVVWRMGVANSFTMEATFCGSTLGTVRWVDGWTHEMSVLVCDCGVLIEYPAISSPRAISLTWEWDYARQYTSITASPKAIGNIPEYTGIYYYTTHKNVAMLYAMIKCCAATSCFPCHNATSLSFSYQQRILSALAEHIIRSIEKKQSPTDCSPDHPSGTAGDTNPPVPLPDIVTSSLAPAAESKPSKKHHSKHLSKRILRKFSKYNLSLLEEESRCVQLS